MKDVLFQPLKINSMEFKNRIVMLPMNTLYSADGSMSEKDIAFFERRAMGGVSAVAFSAAIAQRGTLFHQYHIDNDSLIPGLTKLADAVHKHDCKLYVQLFHCGRCANERALGGLMPMAPSPVPSSIFKTVPEEMTKEMINEAIQQFADAAVRAKKSGIDAVEVSVSVGYLICEFLSEVTNKRTDEYGGSEENRFRFGLEVFRAIRKACGADYPLMMRLSAAQMDPNGYDINYMVRFCKALEAENLCDLISVTGGWHEAPLPLITYHVPRGGYGFMADAIKRAVKTPIMLGSRLNDRAASEAMINAGICDLIGMARPMLADPDVVNKIEKNVPYNMCQGCSRACTERSFKEQEISCIFNPEVGQEYRDNDTFKAENQSKHILVVGAGPAGMYAAVKAAKKGYKVTLATKEDHLGGTLTLAAIPPRKHDLNYFIANKKYELEQACVEGLYNTEVDEAFITKMNPSQVVLACGGKSFVPPIPGIQESGYIFAADVLKAGPELLAKLKAGKNVVLGGGSVGLETAIFLSEKAFGTEEAVSFYFNEVKPYGLPALHIPVDITIVEMTKRVGADLGSLRRFAIDDAKRLEIKMMPLAKAVNIANGILTVETEEGNKEIPFDNLIMAAGLKPYEPEFVKTLEAKNIPFVKIGDAFKPGSAENAVKTAFEWSLTL